ncbi:hypothetical protein [Persicimonas caeni]|uniref:hypothetical protein n=1 Tax=Persicimonas caeni TaxID=2292766 RepID=UPI00143D31B9|nr:hypothetical protein [Persicimonas caeni]
MLLRRFCTLCALLLCVSVASSAFAQQAEPDSNKPDSNTDKAVMGDVVQGWEATFLPSRVNSHVDDDGLKYVVVAAGEADESTEEAAAALAVALRDGEAALVMDDAALGEVAGLDDDKVVAKAQGLPVDQVVIVRVFPGGEGNPDTAVVTVRDKAGEAVWALSGTYGEPVEAKEAEGGGLGVSRNAAEAVGETVESEAEADEEAREQYAKQFIWFQDMIGVNQYGAVVSSWSNAYQGKYRKLLGPEEFYREVGRPDLAAEYSSNSSKMGWGIAMTTVGIVGATVGGSWLLVEGISSNYDADADTTTPLLVTVGSTLLAIGGYVVMPDKLHPIEPSEARELADKHNQKLKEELGLSKDYSPMPQASRNSIKYNFGFGAAPGGAAGVLRVEF